MGTQGKHKPRVHPGVFSKVLDVDTAGLPDGPIMDTEHTDAKAVWEKLRDQGRVEDEPTDVDVTAFPKPEEVLAELRYSFDQTEWAAVVTKDTDDGGSPCFRLWFQRGERFQKSGLFPDGTKLAAYIRAQAAETFKDSMPCIDTLDKLRFKTAASVVPDCFRTHARMPHCRICPYKGECFEELKGEDGHINWRPDINTGPEDPPEGAEEPEDVFLKRLRDKVTDKWGGPELGWIVADETDQEGPGIRGEKPDRIELDEATQHVVDPKDCPHCKGEGELVLIDNGTSERHSTECPVCGGTGLRRPGGG